MVCVLLEYLLFHSFANIHIYAPTNLNHINHQTWTYTNPTYNFNQSYHNKLKQKCAQSVKTKQILIRWFIYLIRPLGIFELKLNTWMMTKKWSWYTLEWPDHGLRSSLIYLLKINMFLSLIFHNQFYLFWFLLWYVLQIHI